MESSILRSEIVFKSMSVKTAVNFSIMTGVSLRKHLQTILEEKLLPAARDTAPLILLEPPVFTTAAEHIEIVATPAKPLPRAKPCRSHIALHYWPEYFLNALRVPYLACVFEGEADITTALTAEQAKQYSDLRGKNGVLPFARQTVSLREPSFFLVPPGAPVSYGSRPHWERPDPQEAYSRIFWIHLLPAGVLCHTCASSRGRHRTHPFIFISDEELPALSQLLQCEMARRESQHEELTRTLLLALLLQLSQAFRREKSQLLATGEAIESAAAQRSGSVAETASRQSDDHDGSLAVARALRFIEANLNQSLDPASIAAHSYISPSHLNRLFQAELGTSVMEYVTRQRLHKARALLRETDLPIAEVAAFCGYANASHFSQLFTRHEGSSPRAFRGHRKKPARSADILSPR
jgi:AraC-like DNA-binding protein